MGCTTTSTILTITASIITIITTNQHHFLSSLRLFLHHFIIRHPLDSLLVAVAQELILLHDTTNISCK